MSEEENMEGRPRVRMSWDSSLPFFRDDTLRSVPGEEVP